METKKILEADYLDLVFNNRNKAYGGYELRKHYSRRTLKALGITMALLTGGMAAPLIVSELHAKTPMDVKAAELEIVTVIKEIETPPVPPKPPVPPAKPAAPPVAPSAKNLPPVIVPPELVKPDDVPPTADELKDKLSAAADNPGRPDGIAAAFSSEKSKPGSDGMGLPEPGGHGGGVKDGNTGAFITVEQMPEFPGGQEALMAFIRKHLRYPKDAIEAEIQGKVYVSFVVNALGTIEAAKIVKGV